MKALDEILLKKIAKEKEVVAQSNALRKQLWEELQVQKFSLKFSMQTPVLFKNITEKKPEKTLRLSKNSSQYEKPNLNRNAALIE